MSSSRDCGECPHGCSFGHVFSKKKHVCTCSCAPDPCLVFIIIIERRFHSLKIDNLINFYELKRKKCPAPQECQVEDRQICRAGNCISIKVGTCVGGWGFLFFIFTHTKFWRISFKFFIYHNKTLPNQTLLKQLALSQSCSIFLDELIRSTKAVIFKVRWKQLNKKIYLFFF